ncbi:MAG: hypothetical protein H6977_02625 [Gammaproteobacteria bacterium]|nr:hypothetical protein [Gammaproteobacteria bacterium]MCP5198880.1 hypothetical protein [Gammaproteobacteria bacterium]
MGSTSLPDASTRTPVRALAGAPASAALATLFVLDALVLGQGLLAAGLVLFAVLVLLPRAWLYRQAGRATRPALAAAGACLACAVAIMVTINFNNHLARSRAAELVGVIEHFRGVAGRYPRSLEELVPRYLPAVPRAKLALGFDGFLYFNRRGRVLLAFADAPPFGRQVYDFATRRWLSSPVEAL